MNLVTQDEPKKPKRSKIELWYHEGIQCGYVRFSQQPVPVKEKAEPVWEFKLKSNDAKYVVSSISYTDHGVIYMTEGAATLVPLSNVAYARQL